MSYDMSRITERLYVGSQINSEADVEEIRAAGISHVIDCQAERDDSNLLRAVGRPALAVLAPYSGQLGYLFDPEQDDGLHPKPTEWFARAVDFALGALGHPGFKVLTHCAAGVNRGPSIVYAVMRAQGFTRAMALDLIHSRRNSTIGGVAYRDDADAALVRLGWCE